MAKSTKGLQVYMTRGDATPAAVVPTAITSAAPAVVTVVNTQADGQIADCVLTGFPELDGKAFVIASATGTEVTLLGSDTSDSTGLLDASPVINVYNESDLELMCWSSLTPNVDEPGTVSVATYCDPTASIPSAVVEAGTISFAGFVDILDPAYSELLAAEEDGLERILRINLPSNGYIMAQGVVSSVTWDLPIDGAIGYTGTFTLSTKLRHIY